LSTRAVFLTYWLVANAAPDGDVYYTVVANSFVHLVSEYRGGAHTHRPFGRAC